MRREILNQFTEGAAPGDAITDHALVIQRWLRSRGYESDVFAASIHPDLVQAVRPALHYRPQHDESCAIYHHSIGSTLVEQLCGLDLRLITIYHNVTPPEYFQTTDLALANQLRRGIDQLALLREHTTLALGVSNYNAEHLRKAGFSAVDVLPLPLDELRYQWPDNPTLGARLRCEHSPLLLFVGRLAPNKCQGDLVKLLYYYRRINPRARLALVGSPWSTVYTRWLTDLVKATGLQEHVILAGHVSQVDLVTYFRAADLYVSMSEHEGVGKPLIESMYLGLPILAYAAPGVAETLGRAGILFTEKKFELVAEMTDLLVQRTPLRAAIVSRGGERAEAFLARNVEDKWWQFVETLNL